MTKDELATVLCTCAILFFIVFYIYGYFWVILEAFKILDVKWVFKTVKNMPKTVYKPVERYSIW